MLKFINEYYMTNYGYQQHFSKAWLGTSFQCRWRNIHHIMVGMCNRDNRMSSRKDCGHRETKLVVLCDKMAMEGSQSGSIRQSCCLSLSENCMLLEISNPNRQKKTHLWFIKIFMYTDLDPK
jgi:hypothetical protein